MANILSLALKINADASGVVKNLTPAERALEKLAGEAAKVTKVFDEFAGTSEAAAAAQANSAKSLADLADSLKRGEISAQQFAENYGNLTGEINKEAAAFKRAAEITKANISPLERYDQVVSELDDQLRAGRITQETFNRAMEKARTDLDRAGTSAQKTDKEMASLARNASLIAKIEIGRLLIDGLSAIGNVIRDISGRLASFVLSVSQNIDSINDLSARTGIGVKSLQGYSLAAKLAGVDTEQFGAAVQKLAVNVGKATPGDALDKSLQGINLSVKELRSLSPEQQFSEIGDAISALPTAADRAAAAVAVFGKQGAALAPLFREGAASIEELQSRAERLGIIVSETQINNVADMNDAFDLVGATIQGIAGQVIGNLAPAVSAVLDDLLRFVETYQNEAGEVGGNAFASAITDAFIAGGELFVGILEKFASVAKDVAAALGVDLRSDAEKQLAEMQAQAANGLAPQVALDGVGFVTQIAPEWEARLAELKEKVAMEQKESAFQTVRDFLSRIKEEIKQQSAPQFRIETNLEQARERFDSFYNGIIDYGSEITASMREYEAAVAAVVDPMNMTAEEIGRIEQAQSRVNQLITEEQQNRQEAAGAAEAQAESDRRRLDQLLVANDSAAKIEQDLLVVQREQARVSAELAAAREDDNAAQSDAAAARQAELDQLQAKLEEQQQALEQGFGQGFTDAFNAVNQNIDGLIAKSQQFGQAGFDAALRLQEGIAAAQQQARDGILNAEAFNAEVQRQQELFNQELANIEAAEKARDKAADDRLAKEKERQEAELKAHEDYRKQQEQALQAYQQQQQKAQEEYAKEQQKIFEEQRKAAEAEAKRQEERLRKLNTLGAQSLSVQDVRTTEGANMVLQLAAGAQDPRLIQERMQTKLLEKIAEGIGQAASNYFSQPVAIVGYADVGGI